MKDQNVKVSDVAKQMNQIRSEIYESLSKVDNMIANKHSGRPRKTSQRQYREILQAVLTQKKYVREIIAFPIS